MSDKTLLCVITGMEQSGTTYLSKLLAADPDIMCGFECGLLLDDVRRFCDVQPWYDWMQQTTAIGHWGILPENMAAVCAAPSYDEAYGRIKRYAGDIGPPQVKRCFQQARYLIDKTPRYVYRLDRIMAKVDAPFIVIRKKAAAQYLSHKKRDTALPSFLPYHHRSAMAVKRAAAAYPERLLVISYEGLRADEQATLKSIYAFLNRPYPGPLRLAAFFERTGLDADTFTSKAGGMPKEFSGPAAAVTLTEREKKMLRVYERYSFIPSWRILSYLVKWLGA